MDATSSFKAGQLQQALAQQIQAVKKAPADQSARLFLFELLAFTGDLARARQQLDVLDFTEPEMVLAKNTYLQCLDAEQIRRQVFAGTAKPKFFGEPAPGMTLRLEAFALRAAGQHAEAAARIHQANETVTPQAGTLNGQAFDVIRDCDDLLGDVIEVFGQGFYFWITLDQMAGLTINPPTTPRDLLWLPANMLARDGRQALTFLPALYAGSHAHADEAVQLGRKTEYVEEHGLMVGVGQHEFLVGDAAVGLLEWRSLEVA